MSIPHAVLAAGWIPFVVVLVLILLFSFCYVYYYQSRRDKELCSTTTSVLGLTVALLTCALIPVDIFLVSFMKDADGHFKDWAQDVDTRTSIEKSVLYAYYALYACVVLFVFLLLPVAYFYYEEGGEETDTIAVKCCTAIKYSAVFILMAIVLFLIGAFVPFRDIPSQLNTTGSDWDKIKNIFAELGNNHAENAMSFTISALSLVGMLSLVLYTASGMASWPVDMLKGHDEFSKEYVEVPQSDTRSDIQAVRNKYRSRSRVASSRRSRGTGERESILQRRARRLVQARRSCMQRCARCLRPLEIGVGLLCMLLALLIFVSLLLTNIDKIMNSLGMKMGYALPTPHLPNPIDLTLLFAQKVFPLDYVLIFGLVLYCLLCSMAGIRNIGVWFCWIRMYKIRPQHTRPQALLFLCFLLMFIVLALNVMVYQIAPQYATYGSQYYWPNSSAVVPYYNVTSTPSYANMSTVAGPVRCSTRADENECVMTRMSMLLYRFFFKLWFFGAAYYWCTWAFLLVFVLAFLVSIIRKRRVSEGEYGDDEDMGSDEELLDP